MDITTLTQLLRDTEKHHGPYEATGDAGLHLPRAQAHEEMSG
jgi:hypothetical protein